MSLLPEGYKRLLYIESTGTQYVDTGLSMPTGFHTVMDFTFTTVGGLVIGSYDSASPHYRNFFGVASGGWMSGHLGYAYFGKPAANTDYVADYSNIQDNIFCKLNGETQTFDTSGATSAQRSSIPLLLFAVRYTGGGIGDYSKIRLRSCKIYSSAGYDDIVADYIPAKLSDGSIGLIDKLTGEFYPNRGAGAFIAGPVVEEEIPPRKVTVDLIPPMTGEKTEDFTIEYSVVDDAETESFETVEYIDGVEQRSLSVAANEKVSTLIESTGMADGLHTFMLVVDGTVEVEYSFYVNNTTTKIEATELSINMPTTVNVNEKFLMSVIITELSFTIAKLKIHAGDVYSGEV